TSRSQGIPAMCGRTRCSLVFGFVLDELLAEFPGSSPAHFGEPIVSVQVGEYPREAAERSRRVESVTGRANLGPLRSSGADEHRAPESQEVSRSTCGNVVVHRLRTGKDAQDRPRGSIEVADL